jgi:hypothetical protein
MPHGLPLRRSMRRPDGRHDGRRNRLDRIVPDESSRQQVLQLFVWSGLRSGQWMESVLVS